MTDTIVSSGQTSSGIGVGMLDRLIVLSGGRTSGTVIDTEGREVISAGGVAAGTTVSRRGGQIIIGGTASGTAISPGGFVEVSAGGIASGTTINPEAIAVLGSNAVTNGGQLIVSSGGTTSATTINTVGTETVQSGGAASATVINSGGTETVSSGGTTTNPVIQGVSSLLVLQPGAIVSGGVSFSGSGGSLEIGDTTNPTYPISGFVSGDTIDLTNLAFDSGGTATLGADNALQIVENSNSSTINLDPGENFSGDVFRLAADAGSGTLITEEPVCFCRGTLILTEHGERRIEELKVGDRVTTLAGAARPIVWIGNGRTLLTRANRLAWPIVVRRGALADGVPRRDLYLTHGHALYLDGVLIPVEHLVNHRSIRWAEEARAVEYYHVEFATHEVVFANGTPAESYYDASNRAWFQNTRPGSAAGAAKPTFAPVLTAGEVVESAWARLFERAGGQIVRATTDDCDLHLLVDGARLDPTEADDGVFIFALQGPPAGLRLRSRSGVPSLLGRGRSDHRPLGVAIRQVILEQAGIATSFGHDAPQLREGGCHPPEEGFAWTDGEFALPPRFFAGLSGAFRLIVHIQRHEMRYPLAAAAEAPRRRSRSAA